MSYNNGPKIVTNGLVLALDAGNVKSYSGSGIDWGDLIGSNSGSLINGPIFDNDRGGNIIFDGVDDYIQTTTNTAFGTNPFAIDIWFKPNINQVSAATLICVAASQASTNWQLSFGEPPTVPLNTLEFRSDINQRFASTYVANDSWTNVVISRESTDANGLKIYINGLFDTQYTLTNNFSQVTNYRIGQNRGANRVYAGRIAIIRLYVNSLSATEIQQNFNATRSRFGV